MQSPARPLEGVRVLEAGVLIAGPFCGQLLADFGAEVIKIEDPIAGDPMRQWGRRGDSETSPWWPIIARNKKGITCNLRRAAGQDLVGQLVAQSDVLVENFRPGTLERWGLSPERLHEINPKLVIARVSTFGQTGPYASRVGYGSIGEAMGGLRYIVGDPGTPPSRVGISIGDALGGIFAGMGCLLALRVADQTGRGQVVDAAIYEAVLAVMESLIPDYSLFGITRERTGAVLADVAPSNAYPTADGKMVLVAANQDTVFARLAIAMDRPEWIDSEEYGSHTSRGQRQGELDALIARWTSEFCSNDLLSLLHSASVPAGVIYTARDMLEDAHFRARDAIIWAEADDIGRMPMQNVFPRLSVTPGRVSSTGPRLGEHNLSVYGSLLGMDAEHLRSLRDDGVV